MTRPRALTAQINATDTECELITYALTLENYIQGLRPYCDNCLHAGDEDKCDGCNRKAFNWESAPIDELGIYEK